MKALANGSSGQEAAEPKRKKAKKDPILIAFDVEDDDAEIEAEMKKVFAKDKRGAAAIQLSTKELAASAEDQNLLKVEYHHGAKDFFQLFTKPKYIVRTNSETLTKFVENDLRSLFLCDYIRWSKG